LEFPIVDAFEIALRQTTAAGLAEYLDASFTLVALHILVHEALLRTLAFYPKMKNRGPLWFD
jgi:hypothetical protein